MLFQRHQSDKLHSLQDWLHLLLRISLLNKTKSVFKLMRFSAFPDNIVIAFKPAVQDLQQRSGA